MGSTGLLVEADPHFDVFKCVLRPDDEMYDLLQLLHAKGLSLLWILL